MSKIIFPILLLLSLVFSQVVLCSDINEIKEEALDRLMLNVQSLQRTLNRTLTQLPATADFIYNVTAHANSTAQTFVNRTFHEMHGTTISASMATHLLNSSADVLECVQSIKGEFIDKIKYFYADKFLTPLNEYHLQGIQIQRDDIQKWDSEYRWAISNFNGTYDSFYRDIIKSNTELEIIRLIEEFERICRELKDVITSITIIVPKGQFELLAILESLTDNLRRYTYEKFDVALDLMQGCFNNGFVKNPRIYTFQQ